MISEQHLQEIAKNRRGENLASISVSTKVGEIRNGILKSGNELEKGSHGRVGELVNDLLTELENHSCRIAFIGQVKAGKSSLINALIQKPNFLPTDVNPSTAVVTKLIFGSLSQKRDTALFHFFTEEDWNHLFSLRPAGHDRSQMFSLPSARQKLNELQKRAEFRLGADYKKLLGKHHLISSVTSDVLAHYVSTDDAERVLTKQGQRYTDLTRMAEVFLESKQFSYPSVLIDTPGVNDLFFVRDEITFANLADADIYIIVLTAHHPMSPGDLSLLRVLRGLSKDKIIAIVNRVDVLSDPAHEADALEAYVRQALNREFPHAVIPVILVSALWGNMALKPSIASPHFPVSQAFLRYAEKLGFGDEVRKRGLEKRSYFLPEDRDILAACSGMPRLIDLISVVMRNAVMEGQLLPSAATLAAIAHNAATSSRYVKETLTPKMSVNASPSSQIADFKVSAFNSLKQLESLVASIDRYLNEAMTRLEAVIGSETSRLENYMYRAAGHFAEVQSAEYYKAMPAAFSQHFSQEALKFRSELADGSARYHTDILKILAEKHRQAESRLRNMIKTELPDFDHVVQFGMAPRKSGAISIVSLGKATSFETSEFWEWFGTLEIETGQEQLNQLIGSEFALIVKDILDSSKSQLRICASDGIRRLRLLALSAVFPVVEHIESSMRLFQAYNGGNPGSESEANAILEINKLSRESVAHYEFLYARLDGLKKDCFLAPMA
jgi:ethanolamine utilization protein EutP (predicted NTPase)